MTRSLSRRVTFAALLAWGLAPGAVPAADFGVEEVPSLAALDPARLKPGTVAFADPRKTELADPATGLIRFEDWAKTRPVQKQLLSLYPAYAEPVIQVTANGITKPYKEKLHVYVAEARFVLDKAPGGLDLARLASLPFVEAIDPQIKHRTISSADAVPLKSADEAHNRHPGRRWCEAPGAVCLESRYQLEGKLPLGIRLANKLEEGAKKIAEVMEFQSELRVVPPQELDQAALAKLTGLDAPVAGALEQSIFHVNQMMQFGKFLAVFQPHPADPGKTVATAYVALAVETDVLEKKKEFERVPVLRNMVPAQVLVGNSSFNTGTSISAGLPDYARNRIKAVAGRLDRG